MIPASMQVAQNNMINVIVDDSAAQYPLVIDPIVGDENWLSMGGRPGTNSTVHAAVFSGTNLYIGGGFTVAGDVVVNGIAKWNGTAWSALGSGMDGIYPVVYALAVDGSGNLYAVGNFTAASGVAHTNYIAKWNGKKWSALGTGVDGPVCALAVSGSTVYAGGVFINADGVAVDRVDGVLVNRIAKWNGTKWSALGRGMDGAVDEEGSTLVVVRALALDGSGNLYAGGSFNTAGGVVVKAIAKWNGVEWSALGSGISVGVSNVPGVNALAASGSTVYAGGDFTAAGGIAAKNIAKWNGTAWSALGSGISGGGANRPGVNALVLDGSGNLYAGGEFATAGALAANNIAKWNGSGWIALGSAMGGGWIPTLSGCMP